VLRELLSFSSKLSRHEKSCFLAKKQENIEENVMNWYVMGIILPCAVLTYRTLNGVYSAN